MNAVFYAISASFYHVRKPKRISVLVCFVEVEGRAY